MLNTGHLQYFRTDQEKNDPASRQSSLGILGKILHEIINYASSRNVLATAGEGGKKLCPIGLCTRC